MKKFFLVTVISVLTLSSCGIHKTVSPALTETRVELSQANFNVVGQAFGSAKATYVLGIGGLSKKGLRNNAIDEMYKNANLSGAQTLTNITTHSTVRVITPLYVEVTMTATANIVEFK